MIQLSHDRPAAAIALVCVATFCFVAMNACVKTLSSSLTVLEIIWGRYFFHMIITALLFPAIICKFFKTPRRDLQILRSVLVLGATSFAFTALKFIPIATLTAVGFIGPIIVVTLAACFLKERVSIRRWVAIAFGFFAVLVILRPGLGNLDWAMWLPILMAACYAGYQVMTRLLRGMASPQITLFYSALVGTVVTTILLPWNWETPQLSHWILMVASGLLGCGGHLALIRAYECAPASIAAPFVYSELIWAVGMGWIFFGHFPDFWTWVGAILLVSTGIYLIKR